MRGHEEGRTARRVALHTALVVGVGMGALTGASAAPKQTGNGGDNGNGGYSQPSFGLEVIAFQRCPAGEFKGTNRRMIAVQADFEIGDCTAGTTCADCCLVHEDCDSSPGASDGFCDSVPSGKVASTISRVNDILLGDAACTEGVLSDPTGCPGDPEAFEVYDGNACDADGAKLFLPTNVSNEYLVGIRLVGVPGGKIGVTTCATEKDTGDCDELTGTCVNDGLSACLVDADCDVITCSEASLVKVREVGSRSTRPRFTDATRELLFVCLDAQCTGDSKVALFDPAFMDFFWNWNVQGRPHAQLRFWEKVD